MSPVEAEACVMQRMHEIAGNDDQSLRLRCQCRDLRAWEHLAANPDLVLVVKGGLAMLFHKQTTVANSIGKIS